MFTAGVRAQLATNHFAVPLLRENKQALIIHTAFWDENKYTGQFYYDLAKNAIVRMAYGEVVRRQLGAHPCGEHRIPIF